MRKKTSYEKSRLKELLWFMILKYQPLCYLCKKEFKLETDLPSRGVDQITEHHKDGCHYNKELSNRALVHRKCHKSHHAKDNILFWSQFR